MSFMLLLRLSQKKKNRKIKIYINKNQRRLKRVQLGRKEKFWDVKFAEVDSQSYQENDMAIFIYLKSFGYERYNQKERVIKWEDENKIQIK